VNLSVANVPAGIRRFIQARFDAWLQRRMPGARHHRLSNKNIFIFPTGFGFVYLFFVLLLFLLGTNYQNNVIILLSYLLASLFVTCMMQSFFNLSGLSLQGPKQVSGFAGQGMQIPIDVRSTNARHGLNFEVSGQAATHLAKAEKSIRVQLPYLPGQRGLYRLKRVLVSSEFALGLFRSWTRLDFDCQCLIYPKPKAVRNLVASADVHSCDKEELRGRPKPGQEDFAELKTYVPGEPLSRVAWKQYARGQGFLSKAYQQQSSQLNWLSLSDMPAANVEEKLQLLCFLILEHHKSGQAYGVKLINSEIPPASGSEHLNECLAALARFPKQGESSDA